MNIRKEIIAPLINKVYHRYMKILYLNCNYFTGIRGGWRDYLLRGYRYVYHRKKAQQKHIEELKRIIAQKSPDVVCLTEVRSHHLHHFRDVLPHFFAACKYGKTIWSRIPWLKKNQIALLSKQHVSTQTGSFSCGMKRAFLQFQGAQAEGYFVHLSLRARLRKIQIHQLRSHAHNKAFFFGDFNTLSKIETGVCPIFQHRVGQVLSYPAQKPKKSLDHCIGKICHDISYFDSGISDHLGMMFRVGTMAV